MAQGSSNPTSNLQKVAGTVIDTNAGNASAGTQRVVLATNQPAVAVTGTFYQATQPVSIASMPTTAVTGTFWQATQPVSGTVSINAIPTGANAIGSITNTSFASTQSGTWTVQPGNTANTTPWLTSPSDGTNAVAIKAASTAAVAADPALVVAISPNNTVPVSLASVPTHGVTGTFWQATQPVSGTFYQATQPVSLASLPALTTGSAAIGSITNTSFIATGTAANGVAVSGNPVLIAGSDGTLTRSIKTATDGTLLINGVQDARQTANITTATSVVGPYSVVNRNVVTIAISGTYAGVTFVIEATDDGTNWYGLQCINNATGQASASWTPGTNALASYDTAVGGYTQVRVRTTAWGSGVAVVGISNQVFAYDPIVAAIGQGTAANGSAVLGNPVLIGGSDGTNARNLLTDTTGAIKLAAGTNAIGSITNTTFGVTGTFWQATQPVSGTFYQATQPVSIATMPSTPVTNAGTFAVQVTSAPTTAVTGTFWQATQPVSGSLTTVTSLTQFNGTAISMKAASVAAVATDPALVVAISPNNTVPVSIASMPTTAVTGTFYQATQPVSIASMPSTPVTGTFWQATQPVSGSLTTVSTVTSLTQFNGTAISMKAASVAAVAADPALVVAISPNNTVGVTGTFYQATQPVSGTFWQTTQPVSIASMPSTPVTGTFYQATQPVSGTFWQATQPVSGTVSVAGIVTIAGAASVTGSVSIVGTTSNALTNTTTTAYAASLIIKASAGTIYTLNGFNSKASAQFIQLHNSATLPADAAVPVVTFYVPASSNFSFDWGVYGRSFSAGIVVANSSTGPTKTIGAADCWFDATSK